MLSLLSRLLLLRSLFGTRRSGRRHGGRRRSSGFGMTGPFPSYSRRTRGGGRVSVGGCCLPIPLGIFLIAAGLGRTLATRGR